MEKHNCKEIIFSISATVYNPLENGAFSEYSSTGNTTNPYGTTKFIIENLYYFVIKISYFQILGSFCNS